AAWEDEILPLRIADYDPAWLDALCASGRIVWTRRAVARSAQADAAPRAGPVRSTPIALVARRHSGVWTAAGPSPVSALLPRRLSADARAVEAYIASHGAAFFDDLVAGTSLLRTQVERALGELVALGLASCDSFAGLRALLVPTNERRPLREGVRPRRR